MRFLKDDEFKDHAGKVVRVEDDDSDAGEHDARTGDICKAIIVAYDVNHRFFVSKDQVLTIRETASFNAMSTMLDEDPNEQGYYEFENAWVDVLKKIAPWTYPLMP